MAVSITCSLNHGNQVTFIFTHLLLFSLSPFTHLWAKGLRDLSLLFLLLSLSLSPFSCSCSSLSPSPSFSPSSSFPLFLSSFHLFFYNLCPCSRFLSASDGCSVLECVLGWVRASFKLRLTGWAGVYMYVSVSVCVFVAGFARWERKSQWIDSSPGAADERQEEERGSEKERERERISFSWILISETAWLLFSHSLVDLNSSGLPSHLLPDWLACVLHLTVEFSFRLGQTACLLSLSLSLSLSFSLSASFTYAYACLSPVDACPHLIEWGRASSSLLLLLLLFSLSLSLLFLTWIDWTEHQAKKLKLHACFRSTGGEREREREREKRQDEEEVRTK